MFFTRLYFQFNCVYVACVCFACFLVMFWRTANDTNYTMNYIYEPLSRSMIIGLMLMTISIKVIIIIIIIIIIMIRRLIRRRKIS